MAPLFAKTSKNVYRSFGQYDNNLKVQATNSEHRHNWRVSLYDNCSCSSFSTRSWQPVVRRASLGSHRITRKSHTASKCAHSNLVGEICGSNYWMEMMDSASEVKIDRTFFDHLESFDIYQILKCDKHIYSVLPLLTRCCLCSSSDISQQQEEKKQKLMKTLLNYDDVNFLIESLSTDFNQLSIDCISQLSLR